MVVNIPLSSMDRPTNKKINNNNNKTTELLSAMDQMDLTDIHRTSDSTAAEWTLCSLVHNIFSKLEHVPGQEASLNTSE